MKVSGQYHALAALLSGRNFGTHQIGRWVGPRAVLSGCEMWKILAAARLRDPSLLQTSKGPHCASELCILYVKLDVRPTHTLLGLQEPLWHKLMKLMSGILTLIFPSGMKFVRSDRHLISVECHFPSQQDWSGNHRNRNVILGLIRANIFAVEKQQELNTSILTVCLYSYFKNPACKALEPYCTVICGQSGSTIFFYVILLTARRNKRTKALSIKDSCNFLCNYCLKHFFHYKKINRDIINVQWWSFKVPAILVRI
jgi:hypothetical protein